MASFDPVSAALEIGGKLLDRFLPDPAQKAAAQLELTKMAQTGELAKMTNETETIKAYMADTASARDREAKIATADNAPYINKVIGPCLAIGILGGALILFLCMIFGVDETFGTAQKEIMLYILGVISAMCTQIISYYFGSSRSDAAKDQHLRELMKNGH